MHLLIALGNQIDHFLLAAEQRRQGGRGIGMLGQQAVFGSKGEMRKLVQGGGVSLNKEKLEAFDQVITTADLLDEKYLLVQRGKKNYYLLIAK